MINFLYFEKFFLTFDNHFEVIIFTFSQYNLNSKNLIYNFQRIFRLKFDERLIII